MFVRALCVWFIVLDLAVIGLLRVGRRKAPDSEFRAYATQDQYHIVRHDS
jgi:hypothetical protein